jgi:archaellum component FlaC
VNTAVVRVMSQHMDVEALACYNDLADEVKNDYNRMTTELKAFFKDPSERQNFINRGKTRRERGAKIKAFARRVQIAIETNMPELQDDAAAAPNRRRPKELEGVNRFMKGIQNKVGKRDDDLDEHMKYQLFADEDKTVKRH